MKTYQDAVLREMERVANRFELDATVSYNYSNDGEIIAGTPFHIAARANFDFQSNSTTIRFNGAPLGPGDMSYRWAHDDVDKANAMLQKWQQLVKAAVAE